METTHKAFKPFQKVLVRTASDKKWNPDFISYYDEDANKYYCIGLAYTSIEDILPYESNEHLVGTTNEPEERIQVKYWEWIMALSGCLEKPSNEPSDWYLEQFNHISGEENIETKRGCHYCYFIRFSDFNPNDMEATKAKILCVKNGKIIRYKG